jgi:hypothetical protein
LPSARALLLVGDGLCGQLLVGEALDLGLVGVDLRHDGLHRFEALALPGVKNLVEETHAAGESTGAA